MGRVPAWSELPKVVRETLLSGYKGSETGAAAFGLRQVPQDWLRDRWCEKVLEIEVDVQPGGRAVLHHPGKTYHVVIQRARRGSFLRFSDMHVLEIGQKGLEIHGLPDLAMYAAALRAYLRGTSKPILGPIPSDRPASGQAPKIKFYRELHDQYNALVREGLRAPAKELAARYGTKHSTMKTWLSRGRSYLK